MKIYDGHKLLVIMTVFMLLAVSGCAREKMSDNDNSENVQSQIAQELSTPYPTSTPYPISNSTRPQESPTPKVDALFIYNRAVHSLRIEEYTDAVNSFTQVIKRLPDLAIAYKGRGGAYYYSERIDFAIEDLTLALSIDPNLGGAHMYLGMIYRDQGDLVKAEEYLNTAVELIHPIRERWEMEVAIKTLRDLKDKTLQ